MPLQPTYTPGTPLVPIYTALPSASAAGTASTAAATANQPHAIGMIADQIITAMKGGIFYTYVADYYVTSAVSTILTTAGYTVGTAGTPFADQVKISWT